MQGWERDDGFIQLGGCKRKRIVLLEKRTVKYNFEVRNCLRIQIHIISFKFITFKEIF